MKEIGKLIELLNECQKENKRPIFYNYNKESDFFECGSISGIQTFGESGLTIISKRFGFIKWLVENDKIDTEKIENSEYYLIDWFYYNERKKFGIEWLDDVEKILLMLLSISDTPIEDLIYYLK